MRNKFIRTLLALSLSVPAAITANAQANSPVYVEPRGWSIGMNIGKTELWGDVGTKSIVDHFANSKAFNKPCFKGGLYARYTVHPSLSFRLQFNYGVLYATDAWNYDKAKKATDLGQDAFQRYSRNQDIKDNLMEGCLMFELEPFRANAESKAAHRAGQVYLLGGVSYFHFQPYSSRIPRGGGATEFIKIYDLHLEGDGFGAGYPPAYSLWNFAIPVGIGYRWDLGQHLNLGIEYTYHYCFTDYLDGVSGKYVDPTAYAAHLGSFEAAQAPDMADKTYVKGYLPANTAGNLRGDAAGKDSYSTVTISLFYKVKTKKREWWH